MREIWINRTERRRIRIGFDEIRARITGKSLYKSRDKKSLDAAIKERNQILESLSARDRGQAWFITSAPTRRERQHWKRQLGCWIVLIDPGMQRCWTRLAQDDRRRDQYLKYKQAALKWYRKYEPGLIDEVI